MVEATRTEVSMRFLLVVVTVALAAGCGGEEEVPSCQQAVDHYYSSGCAYYDLETGEQLGAGEVVAGCRDVLERAPASCDEAIDDWLFCLDGVPDDATSNAECDCSQEQERILTCG